MSKAVQSPCIVCGAVQGKVLCGKCSKTGLLWAARQAHAAANPPAPPECEHDWLQVRGGKVCYKCQKQVSG